MSQVDDSSKQAIDNLNNKVDQKRLAWENRFLRWLCIAFAVTLVLTLIFNPSDTVPTNETDAMADQTVNCSLEFCYNDDQDVIGLNPEYYLWKK